jgi:ribulose-phosphate 3-epimerase
MTINPGFGHQRFMYMTLPKIRQVRRLIAQFNLGCELELDGGIDATTAPLGVAAGADVLVAGSAIFDHGFRHKTWPRRLVAVVRYFGLYQTESLASETSY